MLRNLECDPIRISVLTNCGGVHRPPHRRTHIAPPRSALIIAHTPPAVSRTHKHPRGTRVQRARHTPHTTAYQRPRAALHWTVTIQHSLTSRPIPHTCMREHKYARGSRSERYAGCFRRPYVLGRHQTHTAPLSLCRQDRARAEGATAEGGHRRMLLKTLPTPHRPR